MMSNLFLHPALPLLVGSILIFISKNKSKYYINSISYNFVYLFIITTNWLKY